MNSGNPGYAERLRLALSSSYGDFVETTTVPFNGTSAEFIVELNAGLVDFGAGYDVILFEPFTLNSNGEVSPEDGQQHIKEFHERLRSAVEDSVLVLHPSNPIYNAVHYPKQVNALQEFAKDEGIPYVNTWLNWPDTDSDEIKDLLDDKSMPNSDGAEVWANSLITYFIAE